MLRAAEQWVTDYLREAAEVEPDAGDRGGGTDERDLIEPFDFAAFAGMTTVLDLSDPMIHVA